MQDDGFPEQIELDAGGDRKALATVSNELVRIHRRLFGRGPQQARTDWAGPNTLVTVLHGTLTTLEEQLVRIDEERRVRDARLLLIQANGEAYREAVEQASGRTVRSHASAVDTTGDGVAIETFVLVPADAADARVSPTGRVPGP